MGKPITANAATKSLRASGFSVYRDTRSPCAPQIATLLANVFTDGPRYNAENDALIKREGTLFCEIDQTPLPAQRDAPRRIFTYGGRYGGIQLIMDNVGCRLYPRDGNLQRRKTKLLQAFRTMRRA